MSKLRHSTTTLAVLALVAVPALATAPASAQDKPPPPVEFFVFTNVMENPDDNNDGTPDRRWQVQITAGPLGGCVPRSGGLSYTSTWIEAGEQVGASLGTKECVFRIAAKVAAGLRERLHVPRPARLGNEPRGRRLQRRQRDHVDAARR